MNISNAKNIDLPLWCNIQNYKENAMYLPDSLKDVGFPPFLKTFDFLLNEPDLYTDKDGEVI